MAKFEVVQKPGGLQSALRKLKRSQALDGSRRRVQDTYHVTDTEKRKRARAAAEKREKRRVGRTTLGNNARSTRVVNAHRSLNDPIER